MKPEAQKNKRARASVLAALLAIALLLTGTFAWRSMSQKAANEFVEARNPGGRVHDDFNGMKNKDVYVENFTGIEDGAPVFARVKLLEYMEIGADAGKNRDDPNRQATSLVPGAYLNQPDTWQVYIPGRTDDKFREYWNWTMGGETTYLPTFNKNKDSLSADVNGTYVGPNGEFDDVDPYEDYKEYEADKVYTGTEYYDADDNDDDEYIKDGVGGSLGNGGVLGTNYNIKADVEHVALKTLNGQGIISMAEWKAQGSPICNKWVYDEDGWFYWPEPILPQTATGLLLDKVDQRKNAGERSYYAIEVVGQFSNGVGGGEGDKWGDSSITDDADPNKGFYADGFSEDAKALLDQAASVLFGKEDGKWYLPEPENNNLYKEVKDDAGTLSDLVSAGMDAVIGTADDRTDVVTHTADIEIGGKNYGKYYLPATEAEPFYRVNGDDGKLGTKTDTYFWLTSGSEFPSENVTSEPVTSVTVTVASDRVKNDTTLTFAAEVETTLGNKDVTWSVSGNKSAETTISEAGLLTVKGEDIDTELTVTATSKLDPRKSASATVKVVSKFVDITVSGESVVRAGSHLDLGVTVAVDEQAVADPAVTWAALDESGKKISGVEIDANGKLTVADTVDVGTKIKVTAAYTVDGRQTVSPAHDVEVLEKNSIRVTPSVMVGGTTVTSLEAGVTDQALSLDITDSDGKTVTPTSKTWSVTTTPPEGTFSLRSILNPTEVAISEDGKLTIGDEVAAGTTVKVTCEIEFDDPENPGSTLTASGSATLTVAGPDSVVITNTQTTVPQNGTLNMTAQLKKSDSTDYASNKVVWELSGATQAGTKIDPSTGVLTVAEEPLNTILTVTAKALVDEEVKTSKNLKVAGPDSVVFTTAPTKGTQGTTVQFAAEARLNGAAYAPNSAVTWSVSGNKSAGTTISTAGLLTIADDETADGTLTVTATSKADTNKKKSVSVTVVRAGPDFTKNTVTLDGIPFYVLYRDTTENKALLLSKDILMEKRMDGTDFTHYHVSELRNYLNGEWLNGKTEINSYIQSTTIKTRKDNNSTEYDTDNCKVFLLSQADVFGKQWSGGTYETGGSDQTAVNDDYTVPGVKLTIPGNSWIANYNSSVVSWWLRSPRGYPTGAACVSTRGTIDSGGRSYTAGVRPAMWVKMSTSY